MDGIRPEIVQSYEEETTRGYSRNMRVDWGLADSIFNYVSDSLYLISGWIDTAYGYMESASGRL